MHAFTLSDGRQLAYAWWGAPRAAAARTVLHLHGFLASRLEGALLHADAVEHGLSVLSVDRPGAGGSVMHPRQSVDTVAGDLYELLEGLGLQQVVVMGASGGAPYACALAARLGHRAQALLLVCPMHPTAGREAELLPGTSPSTLRLFQGARERPWRMWATLHTLRLIQRVPHGNLLLRVGGFAEVDQAAMLESPRSAVALQVAVREGLRGREGVAAALHDLQHVFYCDSLPVDLTAIRCPAHIWHGALDTTTPPAMASAYARALPAARLRVLEGEGHLSLPFRHNARILGSVAESAVNARM